MFARKTAVLRHSVRSGHRLRREDLAPCSALLKNSFVSLGFPQRLKAVIHSRLTARLKSRALSKQAPADVFSSLLERIFSSPRYRVILELSLEAGTFGCSYSVALGRPSTRRMVSRIVWTTGSFPTAVLSMT